MIFKIYDRDIDIDDGHPGGLRHADYGHIIIGGRIASAGIL